MSHSVFKRQVGTRDIVIETGRLAQQANGAVLMQTGDSAVLVTATMSKPREGIDFFPLTIDFEERLYARGKIPGNFFRREGRPSFDAILTDRLTDRPLRPLFPKGFRNEVQIIATALSADQESPLDMLVLNGASAALSMSNIPFGGPIGATRVGFVDGEYVINPTYQQLAGSQLDLVVAGSRDGVMMMEAGASELSEAQVLKAIQLAQDANLEIITLQEEIVREVGVEKVEFITGGVSPEAVAQASGIVGDGIARALDESNGKADQAERLDSIKATLFEQMEDEVKDAFEALLEREFRARILDHGKRPDGRGVKDLRELSADTGILPRTHGTGLFQRGETQVLGVATLGSSGDVQRLDNLSPNDSKRFMLHYNFPPFSTGETGRVGSPGRREIGHGALAERALLPVIPSEEDFPYVIRLVADVLSSNGSTSQASVCACTLALMDAGVPITRPVAGISVGLVTGDDGRFAILTDIQGMEDHFGDMDFKVAGTSKGITAIQLDIKIESIGWDVIEATLEQAREARLNILEVMRGAIEAPRADLSEFAPRMTRISIPISKIGAVIGPGGKTIRAIVEETKATVDVADDGTVTIGSSDADASNRAVAIIEGLTREAKIGDKFKGKVVRIMNFGAFVEILPGTDGMVHISELSDRHVPTVEDVVALGDEIEVEVIGVDHSGRISLSRRSLLQGGDDNGGSDSDGPRRNDGDGDSRGGQGGYRDRPPQGGGSRSGPPRDRDRGPRR